jgi:fructokinase
MKFGSIEAGGTKFICAIGDEQYKILNQIVIPTTTPNETLQRCVEYFQQFTDLTAMSIASFGPIEIRPHASQYGYITDTPKPYWSNTNFLGTFQKYFSLPIYWTTDVNGSAYGEYVMAIKKQPNLQSLVYYTFGTGVGAGIINHGKFMGTLGHPEAGHVYLQRHPKDYNFVGICPYHHNCLEGLTSGPTFNKRCNKPGTQVPFNDPVWDIISFYIAQAVIQSTLLIRPQKIILGGGVISEPVVIKVRAQFKQLFQDYLNIGSLNDYLTMPICPHNSSATVGNLALAAQKYYQENMHSTINSNPIFYHPPA